MEPTAETLEQQQNAASNADSTELNTETGAENLENIANDEQTDPPASEIDGSADEGEGEDELTLQFGDEASPTSTSPEQENAPAWVKALRKDYAAAQRRIRELEAKEKTLQQPQETQVPTLGAKPKLEDFDYDEGKFDEALGKWYDTKREVEAAQAKQRKAAEERQQAIQARQTGYLKEATDLRVKDFQDAETEVVAALSVEQQGILLAGADKPALLVYALGRHPTKLQTLAQIKDPVRFAFAAAKLEKELKVTSRTASKPTPEGRVSSGSSAPVGPGASERKLEQLRAEAEKTGDMSKVIAYKAQMKKAQQKR